MKIEINKNRKVGPGEEPYIIAELGANHNGDMDLAKKLIIQAKDSGADCVKFQSWSKNSIFSKTVYSDNRFLQDDYRDRNDYTLEEIVDQYSISEAELKEIKHFTEEIGIDCTSTPFSNKEVDHLVNELNVDFIKIASMDLNNYPFLEYIATKNKPIVLSTGLSTLAEIDKAIQTIENTGNKQIVILHCIALYPPTDEQINLNNIDTLSRIYPYPIGFSDHTIGTCIPIAAMAKGACIIEKHFTLDKKMEGGDHAVSADKEELKIITKARSRISKALGSKRINRVEDQERQIAFRRSIVTARDIKKGEILTNKMLCFKRPGSGIEPSEANRIVGKKANCSIAADTIIKEEWII